MVWAMIAMFTMFMSMIVTFLSFLLFFFLIIGITTTGTTHVEVIHVIGIPILTNWLGSFFLIFINPFGPVDLEVSVLKFIFSESWPVFGIIVLLDNIENDISTFSVPLALFNINFVE
jgi:hypothetical protein